MTFPSPVFIGPFIVPEKSAMEHVWLPSPRGRRPAGPVHRNVFGVTLPKSLPERTSRSGIPSIVQRRHQVDQLSLFHGRPLGSASSTALKKPCRSAPWAREPLAGNGSGLHTPTTRGEFRCVG